MRFDDIGQNPIYWCAACGPLVAKIEAALTDALKTQPGFEQKLGQALDNAEGETK